MHPGTSLALETALQRAEQARAEGRVADGLVAAEQAWVLATDGGAALRLRAGLLLLHFRYRSGALAALVDAGLEVLPLLRQAGGPVGELIDTLRMVVIGAADTGRFDTALALGQEAQRLAEAAGDQARLSMAINGLGAVYERIGDPWHSERLLLDALAIAREAGAQQAEFVSLNNLVATLVGAYYQLHGTSATDEQQALLERAESHALPALQLADALGDDFFQAFAHGNYGEALVHLGRTAEARRELERAQAVAQARGFEAQSQRIGVSMGELLLREGRPQQAWDHMQQVLQASATADGRMTRLRLHHLLWRTARELQRADHALEHLELYLQHERERLLIQLRGHSRVFLTQVEAEQVRLEARRAVERAQRAEVDARVDALTGLGNRRELDRQWRRLASERQVAERQGAGGPLSLAMLDLDHFKRVNDGFGHAVGDQVLMSFARLLRENLRADDVAIRAGGEEFIVLLPDTGSAAALEVCERLRLAVAAHGWELLAPGLHLSLSGGVVTATGAADLRTLIERADAALYDAKHGGRNRMLAG